MNEFPQSVIEEVGYYVYALRDPRSGDVFYVGKGSGNRVFQHANADPDTMHESDKGTRILDIRASGHQVHYEILRHGMSEDQALEVEAALIDYIGLSDLGNAVAGLHTRRRGRMTAEEVAAIYKAGPVVISEPSLLIIVNRLFRRNMPQDDLYEITRGNWVLGKRRDSAKYAFSVYKGIVRQVYRIHRWNQAEARNPKQKTRERWRFEGEIATDLQHYVGGDVGAYIKRGAQSPVKYVNC